MQALPRGGELIDRLPDTLRLRQLPLADRWLSAADDTWVLRYQQALEKLGRKRRQAGEAQAGVFFTPKNIADYLTERTLGARLREIETEVRVAFEQGDHERGHQFIADVRAWKIIDPACGTGVFLNSALHTLAGFYRRLQQPMPGLLDQLYGIDLDPLSIWITEARLVQALQALSENNQLDESVTQWHSENFQVGDTLADNLFPAIEAWDFILANPPYVSEVRGQAERFRTLREHPAYRAKMDLCDAFVLWGMTHLRPGGQSAYVLPEYITQRSASAGLREQLLAEGRMLEVWFLGEEKIFANATGHHTALLIWEKNVLYGAASLPQSAWLGHGLPVAENLSGATFRLDGRTGKLLYGTVEEAALLEKLSELPPLLQPAEIQQGVVLPQGRLAGDHGGLFLLTDAEVKAMDLNPVEQAWLKPYFLPTGFQPFTGFPQREPDYWLIYGTPEFRRQIDTDPSLARLKAHLDRLRDFNTSAFAPYGLHRPRQAVWFEQPGRILCPRQVMRPSCALFNEPAYVNETFYILQPDQDPAAVCALLNSKLAWFWVYRQKRKGQRLQIDKDVLIHFPSTVHTDGLAELATMAYTLAEAPEDAGLWQRLHEKVFRCYDIGPVGRKLVQAAWEAVFPAGTKKS